MATSITNLAVIDYAQKAINAYTGFADSIKPFARIFDPVTYYGNGVAVPVITPGAPSTGLDFATDDSNAIAFSTVSLSGVSKNQMNIPGYQYVQLEKYVDSTFKNLLNRVAKGVTDAAYALFNTTNWPLASNKVVVSTWSESAPTLAALYSCVETAKKTGKLDPNNLFVLMPSTTYAGLKAALDALPREAALGFTVIPVYASTLTQTAITDGSAVGLAIGADVGVGFEEFDFVAAEDNSIGYGIHVIPDPKNSLYVLGLRAIYGVKVLNATGFLWFNAS